MKRNRFAALAAVLLALSFLLTACGTQENTTTIAVACVVEQPMTDGMETLQMEQRQIPEITGVALYRRMIEEMKRSPANPLLKAVLPTVTVLREIRVEDGVALCTFSENLAEVPPAQLTRILCALTRTLCQNAEIDAIRAVAGTEPLHDGTLTEEDFVMQRDSLHIVDRELTLYYPNEEGTGLETALCSLRLPVDANTALEVMETLLSGPVTAQGYIIRFLADGTKVYSAHVRSGICYVDLSEAFFNENIAAPDGTSLTVYAIVNSLTALPDVTGVQFLIEGEPRQSLIHPHFDQVIMPRTPGAIFRTEDN